MEGAGSPRGQEDILERYGGASSSANAASALEDPLDVLKRGYAVALSLSALVVVFCSRWLLHTPDHPDAWWKFAMCGVSPITHIATEITARESGRAISWAISWRPHAYTRVW